MMYKTLRPETTTIPICGIKFFIFIQKMSATRYQESWLVCTSRIVLRDMSDLNKIYPSCLTRKILVDLFMEYEGKNHCYAKLSQYEILGLFVTQYIL